MNLCNEEMLAVLSKVLEAAQDQIHPEVSAARLATLVAVLQKPGMNQSELKGSVRLAQQGISRAVTAFRGKPAASEYPAMLISTPDPNYSRANILYPTREAQDWVTAITANVNAYLVKRRA